MAQSTTTPPRIEGIYRSTNKGSVWNELSLPIDADPNYGADFTGTQAYYNLIAAVDPFDANTVFVGGIDLFKTTDGGTTWNQISHWYGGYDYPYVHADQHAIVFRPGSSSEVLFGNDGGIYYSTNANQASPTFWNRNKSYNITQFYSCAMENAINSDYYLAGAQDNGTQQFTDRFANYTTKVRTGDGGFCFIDQDNPIYQINSYIFNTYRLSVDGGNRFSTVLFNDKSKGFFINPADYDDRANILYSAGDANELVRMSGIAGTPEKSVLDIDLRGGQITCVKVSPYTDNRIFVGTVLPVTDLIPPKNQVLMIDSADTNPVITNITGNLSEALSLLTVYGWYYSPKYYLSCIEIGSTDDQLLMTISNYGAKSVWETLNATSGNPTWIDREGNLPDIPIRWALYNPDDPNEVILATELGIWSTDNIHVAAPDWDRTVEGLANVRCDMLQIRQADKQVVIATHGRGLYTTDVFSDPLADFSVEREEWFANKPLRFMNRSVKAEFWEWDFDNDGTIDSIKENPYHTYSTAGTYTAKLTINGTYGSYYPTLNITKTITVREEPTIPYFNDFEIDGGGFHPVAISPRGLVELNKWEWGAGENKLNMNNDNAFIDGAANWMTNLSGHHGWSTKYALETPPFSLVGEGNYVLEFKYRAITGTDSGMNIQYSTDWGHTWRLLGGTDPDPAAIQDWYNNQSSIAGLDGQPGWFGQEWYKRNPKYRINHLMNNIDVRFRFVFGARGYAWDGFQIDDFKITK